RPIVDRLNQLIERLEASFTRERRFSADLAHELRTPIAELKTLSEVALKWPDQAGDKTHQETLLIAQDLESVVVTLLTLARWESGDHPIKWEPMILATLLRDSWAPFEAKAEDRGLVIQWDLGQDEATSPYRTDPAILRHILTNLFSNAVEYAPSQTIINVHQSEHELIVTNQAPHLTEDDLAHLFDRHWRADPARTSSDTPHTGLGLALAKACADALGTPLKAQLHEGLLSFRLQLTPPSSEEGATPPYPET
ncbi:MAG: ATP-binding protein, partial [Verrucomicrobiota bacterium]